MTLLAESPDSTVDAVARLFRLEDLPRPPLPANWQLALRRIGSAAFATDGWPAGGGLDPMATHWLAQPRGHHAWVGLVGHGLQSTAVRLCLCRPQVGLFMQRRWTEVFDQGLMLRGRIEGAFGMLARMIEDVDALCEAGRWPARQRLLLVDDDFRFQRWGWLTPGEDLSALRVDAIAYLSVLSQLDRLKTNKALAA